MSKLKVLSVNDDLPIKTLSNVHSGKVRSVYWLTKEDSRRLIEDKNYDVPVDTPLAIMIISDRISAFDCIWKAEGGLEGVPGKGAALNTISAHWFKLFDEAGLAGNHIVDIPHPLVWIVRQAKGVRVEAIARQYITGSMWRSYEKGEREFCGIQIPDGLQRDTKLPEILITPSTKGILTGIPGVPAVDDVNITRKNITENLSAFNFACLSDVDKYEKLLREGFDLISGELAKIDQIFVDTKFEFGYVKDKDGNENLIYMDEVGTPDSSRIWDGPSYREGKVVENSKENFRKVLINSVPDSDVLLNKDRMPERVELAKNFLITQDDMMHISDIYTGITSKVTGSKVIIPEDPRSEILDILGGSYDLVK
ncbi:MAG: phosphoribosylaminoimidazolesuccinocarboxamide synthase [Lentisphaeraceae bacterium]|nr:phosphoribosylaminoimidazolesuccinocarboxamide synthase [Lentisphaeraceae bacterium]